MAAAKELMVRIREAGEAKKTLTLDRCAHLVGRARGGSGPEGGVDVNRTGVPNRLIVDAGVPASAPSANPLLGIMMLAAGAADHTGGAWL